MRSCSSALLMFLFVSCQYSQTAKPSLEKLEYAPAQQTAIQQLQEYPVPRYQPGNNLLRLFNWMDPYYMGGKGQPGVDSRTMISNAEVLQQELILNWNYGINIPSTTFAFYYSTSDTAVPPFVRLANANPQIPLHAITYWMFSDARLIGRTTPGCMILNKTLDPKLYLTFDFYGHPKTEIKFNFPDSLIRVDGAVQRYHLSRLLKFLKRPIDLINEDGEEPPGPYMLDAIKKDKDMIRMKDSMKIASWEDFMAIRKLDMRVAYASSFMQMPELKNTRFSMYTIEAGPVDRFKWSIMKKCMSPRNGIYYSTPDFYPRWPSNWKDWKGPWHGWKWIESGRKVEIKDGDYLFSPFVAPGWSAKSYEDIRPAQWLGLLKCLAVVGAEFYYVGYFNESAPFHDPNGYTWQAAMPAYAQAVTSRFEDVLKQGNVLFDEDKQPIISYPVADPHVLITARKHNSKEKYVICGTYQPFSNDSGEIPEKRIVSVKIDKQMLTFEVRRQGSVYVYEKLSDGKVVFYQLDRWHENAHPAYWSKDFSFEAEAADSGIDPAELNTVTKGGIGDFAEFTTAVSLSKKQVCTYHFSPRSKTDHPAYIWLRYKGKGSVALALPKTGPSPWKKTVKLSSSENWNWMKVPLPVYGEGEQALEISLDEGNIALDRFVLSSKETAGAFKD
jgi:hypothetical protein